MSAHAGLTDEDIAREDAAIERCRREQKEGWMAVYSERPMFGHPMQQMTDWQLVVRRYLRESEPEYETFLQFRDRDDRVKAIRVIDGICDWDTGGHVSLHLYGGNDAGEAVNAIVAAGIFFRSSNMPWAEPWPEPVKPKE